MKLRIVSLVLVLALLVTPGISFADDNNQSSNEAWTSDDFVYEDSVFKREAFDKSHNLNVRGRVIAGFSESGEEKLKKDSDVVLPSKDSDGNTIVGVAEKAFQKKGLTSVVISADSDYVVGGYAFQGNSLTEIDLPENVIACMNYAFDNNKLTKVKFSKSMWYLETRSFSVNEIEEISFEDGGKYGLEIYAQAFAGNRIKSVEIPDNTRLVNKLVFCWNSGMENYPEGTPPKFNHPYTYGDRTYADNGVVHMYTSNESLLENSNINTVDVQDESKHSYVQKLVIAEKEPVVNPGTEVGGDDDGNFEWSSDDFTYGDYEKLLYGCDYSRQLYVRGKAVTGFSESGEKKFEKSKDVVLPSKDADGNILVGVANNAFKGRGINSVVFPRGMMIDYDDTVTHSVTKRGNYVIGDNAFSNNNIKEVYLPSGVIAVLPNAFANNEITTVTFPKTIWWIENRAFGVNEITTVNFPKTTDFSLEMHGWTFAANHIKSVRLPDFTEVVNKDAFDWNPGMEALGNGATKGYESYTYSGRTYDNSGMVHMYTSNPELLNKDRIHTSERPTGSQHSYVQKLVLNENHFDEEWNEEDFTYSGTAITGLSESGIKKRTTTKALSLPDKNPSGQYITAIADAEPEAGGMFSTEYEKFETVELPNRLKSIGNNAFRDSGLKDIQFPNTLESIGSAAFQSNDLTSIVLPNTVTSLGSGAFATNASIERIVLSKGLKEISTAAFACSDAKHYMTKLTSIEIPEGVTTIGDRAFAGNNFHNIKLPSTVKTVGDYAFSTKNYLRDVCTVQLNEGLESLGKSAFRNKCIEVIQLPKTLKSMKEDTFLKAYSDGSAANITEVFVPTSAQYEDRKNFPENDKYHKLYLLDSSVWESEDFTFNSDDDESTASVTGFSEQGAMKLKLNKSVAIPYTDESGNSVVAVASAAFESKNITDITLPTSITSIETNAFSGNKIEELQLPVGIEDVDGTAFADNGCVVKMYLDKAVEAPEGVVTNDHQKLEAGIMDEEPTSWDASDFTYDEEAGAVTGWSESGNAKRLKLRSLVIPKTTPAGKPIVAIGESAFEIPDDEIIVTKFGIESPNGMTSVTLPSTVTKIGKKAFACNTLTQVDLSNLTSIGESAFYGNKLKEAIIPDSVDEMGNGAFANNNITKIRLSKNVTVIPQGAFSMNIRLEHVDIPDTVTEIGQTAFAGARLTSLEIPKSVTKIGTKAFHLHHLTELTIPGNVKELGDHAFEGTFKATTLKKLTIEEGVQRIGKGAFKEALLESVQLPNSLEYLGDEPFLNNKGLNGSHVVEVTTENIEHLSWGDDTYTVKLLARIAGKNRYETAFVAADKYKKLNNIEKFKNVVVACGTNYPDALTGSYLAKVKDAPILLVESSTEKDVKKYIESNLADDGTIYILGGEGVVSKKFEESFKGHKVRRLGGASRYDTNIAILKEAGVTNEELLISTGEGYADSLSASATGRPILLVGKSLTANQKKYIASLGTKKAYAIGGKGVVSDKVLADYKAISGVQAQRVAGSSRYQTSVEVAKTFFGEDALTCAVLAYAQNFPDGLTGSSVAMSVNAPLLLVDNNSDNIKAAKEYCNKAGIRGSFVLGGATLVSDDVAKGMIK